MIASLACSLALVAQPAPGLEPPEQPVQPDAQPDAQPDIQLDTQPDAAPDPAELIATPLVLAVPTEPVAVRGRLEVSAGGARRQQIIEAWFRPGPLPELRVEVGPFLIHAVTRPAHTGSDNIRSVITAVHSGDRGSFVQHEFAGPLTLGRLHEIVPPIPLPQLAQWLEEGAARLPGQSAVAWRAPTIGQGDLRSLMGESPEGPALATVEGDRVRSWQQTIRIGARVAVLALDMEFATPVPGSWAIEIEGRRQLDRLAALQPSNSTIARFQPVPALPIFGLDRQAWTLPSISVERAAGQAEPFTVLLLARPGAANLKAASAAVAQAVAEARDEIADRFEERRRAGERPTPVEVGAWAVLVFELSDFSFPALEAASQTVSFDGGLASLWSASPAATLGRFAPGADEAIVVIDGYRRLVAVLEPSREDLALVLADAITREAWLEPGEEAQQPTDDADAGGG